MIIKINKRNDKLTVVSENLQDTQLLNDIACALAFNEKDFIKALNEIKMRHYGF